MIKRLSIFLIALCVAATAFATVSTNPGRNEYTAGAAQTIFNYTFKIYADTDLSVYQTPAGQTPDDSTDLITGYTVTGAGLEAGGSITLDTGATTGDQISVVSAIPTNRTIDYQFNGDFRPNVVNNDFDRAVSLIKQIEDTSLKSVRYENSVQGDPGLLPPPEVGKVLGYNVAEELTNLDYVLSGTWAGENVTTYATLKALTGQVLGDQSLVGGRNAADDGGGGQFYFDTQNLSVQVTADTQEGVYVAPNSDATGASGAWVRIVSDNYDVRWFGAVGDGATDDTAELQAAISYMVALGAGGTLNFAPGTYITSSALIMQDAYSVELIGDGQGWEADFNRENTPAVIIKSTTGTHNLLNILTSASADNKTSGVTVRGMQFDDGGQSRTCLQITSVNASQFENLTFQMTGAASRGISLFCIDAALPSTEGVDNQYLSFINIGFRSLGATAKCLLLDGNDGLLATDKGNTSKCYFENLHFSIRDGVAIDVNYADANTFNHIFVFMPSVSSGQALILRGTDLADDKYARKNQFFNFQPAEAPIQAKAGTNTDSQDNYILIHNGNLGSGYSDIFDAVTVEVGASLTVVSNTGEMRRIGQTQTFIPVSEGETTAGVQTDSGAQYGRYTVQDGWVHFQLRVAWSAHTGTGNLKVVLTGLPDSVDDGGGTPDSAVSILPSDLTYTGDGVFGFIDAGTNEILIYTFQSNLGRSQVTLDTAAELFVNGKYRIL